MTKEEFKDKLHETILEGIKGKPNEAPIKAFDFKETDNDGSDDGFILGTIVHSRGRLAISTSRWDASTYALDSIDLEIFDLEKEWDAAFEFFWNKVLYVPQWDNPNYEEQLMFEKEEYTHGGFFVIKGSRYN